MRRRKLTPEGKIILLIAVFVLFAVIYPAVFAKKNESSPPGVTIEIKGEDRLLNVYNDDGIKEMALEEYLVGVVAAEMPASFEPEALKAQAVAARTYTYYIMNHGGCSSNKGADICTYSGCCQAYLSRSSMEKRWGGDMDVYLKKIENAVYSTQGEMIYYDGEEIQAFYHACSGGWTEDCANVYVEDLPYLKSVKSEGEESYSHFYGAVSLTPQEFEKAMKKFSPSVDIDTSKLQSSIGEIKRYASGRVESIKVGDEYFTGREIRSIFGLNSAAFSITVSDKVSFKTTGFGHGVGMSQDGADAMAKQGADYKDILKHYYTGVTVK